METESKRGVAEVRGRKGSKRASGICRGAKFILNFVHVLVGKQFGCVANKNYILDAGRWGW
jgi:hypothetical protein